MSKKYRVVVVGMGKRGMHHALAFQANDRFEVAGVCDIDPARLDAAAAKFGAAKGTDARELCATVKPDIFCFCTLPNLRIPMIKAGIEGGARLIAFEKPVALTTKEGFEVKRMLDAAKVKAVVSHQHRYGEHYRKVKEIVSSGALGRVHTVYGTSTGWMTHMLSHLIDYTRWYNAEAPAQWVLAQAAGRGKLTARPTQNSARVPLQCTSSEPLDKTTRLSILYRSPPSRYIYRHGGNRFRHE